MAREAISASVVHKALVRVLGSKRPSPASCSSSWSWSRDAASARSSGAAPRLVGHLAPGSRSRRSRGDASQPGPRARRAPPRNVMVLEDGSLKLMDGPRQAAGPAAAHARRPRLLLATGQRFHPSVEADHRDRGRRQPRGIDRGARSVGPARASPGGAHAAGAVGSGLRGHAGAGEHALGIERSDHRAAGGGSCHIGSACGHASVPGERSRATCASPPPRPRPGSSRGSATSCA
jgi:hypothetical protein